MIARRLGVLLWIAATTATTATARGDEPPREKPPAPDAPASLDDVFATEAPAVQSAPFALTVNHVPQGEIVVILKDGDVLVKRAALADAGLLRLGGQDVTIDGEPLLSLKSVSPPLRYQLDEHAITLHIIAPIDHLPAAKIDLSNAPPNVEYQEKTSAFLNYAARATDFQRADGYGELGVSHHGHLLFSSGYLSSERGARRGLTNYTLNQRRTLQRVTFGDSLVLTGPLGSGELLGGVAFSRTYALDPYAIKAPRIGYMGSTMTPATLDVYVNGARVRSEPLAPGAFELGNLRVGGGRGTARYVIRDVFGHQQDVSVPFYVSSNVLAKGLSEYTYAMGAVRKHVGTESFGYTQAAFMGQHRFGLSNRATLAGRAEATGTLMSGGPAITVLTPIGELELDLGASHQEGHAGFAGFLSYSFISRFFGAGVFGRARSDQYATVSAPALNDRAKLDVGVFHSMPIGQRVALSSSSQFTRYRDTGTAWNVNGQLSMQLMSQLMFLLSASETKVQGSDPFWDVFASLNVVFVERHNASATAQASQHQQTSTLAASKPTPIGRGYGYRASATLGEMNSAQGLAQYQTLSGRYGLGYLVNGTDQHLSLEAAGALAFVPGAGLFATLPLHQAFGLIRLPGVPGVRGYINNQDVGTTDRNGNLPVPNLLSYYGNRLSIAPGDVPLKYNVQVTEMTLAPPQRGAAVAEFPMTIPHYYRGRIVLIDHGERVAPQYGQLRVGNRGAEIASALGEVGEFELEGITPGRHAAWVDYLGKVCAFELDAADANDTVIEMGDVPCTLP